MEFSRIEGALTLVHNVVCNYCRRDFLDTYFQRAFQVKTDWQYVPKLVFSKAFCFFVWPVNCASGMLN